MNIFSSIAKFKVYYGNATFYLSIINFSMLLASTKLLYGINIPLITVVPLAFLGLLVVGYADYKFVSPKTLIYVNKKNDMKHQLNRIEETLKEIKLDSIVRR